MNLKEKGWRGLPLDDTLVIDAHCHYMQNWISDIGEYIRKMDLVGVDKMCMTFSSGVLALGLLDIIKNSLLAWYFSGIFL